MIGSFRALASLLVSLDNDFWFIARRHTGVCGAGIQRQRLHDDGIVQNPGSLGSPMERTPGGQRRGDVFQRDTRRRRSGSIARFSLRAGGWPILF